MKIQLFFPFILLLLTFTACQQPATENRSDVPDYATAQESMDAVRTFLQLHQDENLDDMVAMLSDTLKWSPPDHTSGDFLGKDAFVTQLAAYHQGFENTQFEEGTGLGAGNNNGMWGGSVFPEGAANTNPNLVRAYGTWRTTHSETGKAVNVKWYGIVSFNQAGKIVVWSEWFDLNGIAAQIAAE